MQQREDTFRQDMIQYIRTHFSDLLGEHAALLDQENGLDTLQDMIREGRIGRSV